MQLLIISSLTAFFKLTVKHRNTIMLPNNTSSGGTCYELAG